jgi:hypothetical protein
MKVPVAGIGCFTRKPAQNVSYRQPGRSWTGARVSESAYAKRIGSRENCELNSGTFHCKATTFSPCDCLPRPVWKG